MSGLFQTFGSSIKRTGDFAGRATRREFIVFVVLSQLPVALADWLGGWLAPDEVQKWLLFACHLIVLIPAPALVARRLHDMGLGARWGFILLAVAVLSLGLDFIGLIGGWSVRQPVESLLSWVDWLLYLPATVLYVALLAVPTRGKTQTAATEEPAAAI